MGFRLAVNYRPRGRSGERHRRADARRPRRRTAPGAAGRDRLGQDVHHGQGDRGDRAGRRWSWRTTRRWPRSSTTSSNRSSRTTRSSTSSATTTTTSRKPTFLRATSTSRRKPPSTTSWTSCGSRPPRSLFERRDCVIVASVSCIYGLGSPEAYYGMLLMLEKGQKISRNQISREAGGDPVRAQRHRFPARHVPRARRRHRGLPDLRRQRLPHRAVGRRGGEPVADRSAAGPGEADLHAAADLSQDALRDVARRPSSSAMESIRTELELVAQGAGEAGQADRGAAAVPAHHVRSRDDEGDRLLPRHRELLAPLLGPAARARRRRRCSTTCRTMP